jgi:hypothetical protein
MDSLIAQIERLGDLAKRSSCTMKSADALVELGARLEGLALRPIQPVPGFPRPPDPVPIERHD